MDNLYDNLNAYGKSNIYPYHMPGHKRHMEHTPLSEAYGIDLTEIDGSDNLYHAEGILQEAMQRAAKLYGADETHFLINGSTGGILSAVAACVKQGGHILMARNSHRSAYNAAMLQNLHTAYVYPEYIGDWQIAGGITPEAVRNALAHNREIQAVFITSPTYEGVVSDIEAIAEEVHRYGIPLIVDEAHGAHFGLDDRMPVSAVHKGADIVIQSLHKTLPAFTQTALLHINGNRVDREKVRLYLSVYQTSSPSYVLMAGIDQCIHLLEEKRTELFAQFYENRQRFLARITDLKHIRLLDQSVVGKYGIMAVDDCKLVISVKGTDCNGHKLHQILLQEYGLQMEMAASTYVLAILTIMDTPEGFDRLAEALLAIDNRLRMVPETESTEAAGKGQDDVQFHVDKSEKSAKIVFTIEQALQHESEDIPLSRCDGRVAADYVCAYPPGIPLIVPGEQFTKDVIKQIEKYHTDGLQVLGVGKNQNTVKVVK